MQKDDWAKYIPNFAFARMEMLYGCPHLFAQNWHALFEGQFRVFSTSSDLIWSYFGRKWKRKCKSKLSFCPKQIISGQKFNNMTVASQKWVEIDAMIDSLSNFDWLIFKFVDVHERVIYYFCWKKSGKKSQQDGAKVHFCNCLPSRLQWVKTFSKIHFLSLFS